MKLLNLCCGATRPSSEEWVNLDCLHPVLAEGTVERANLDAEANYVEHDLQNGPIPLESGTFDGVVASHCVEHWDIHEATRIMAECLRILKPQGALMVSVPDASYFRLMHAQDNVENAERLFGEPIHLPDGETTFLGYGGFNRYHKTLLTEDALWCYFIRAGFRSGKIHRIRPYQLQDKFESTVLESLKSILNRLPFSLVMVGVKE